MFSIDIPVTTNCEAYIDMTKEHPKLNC